ncbi:MAG TPA: hypothetical protein VGM56_31090, partial [Byssovorax sp.]
MTALRLAVLGAALALAGCDAGGLLDVSGAESDAGPPQITGPSVDQMVNGGTVAKNGKYKLVYTLGQPSPNQGPATNGQTRENGGLVG